MHRGILCNRVVVTPVSYPYTTNIAIRTCRYCWLNVPIASASVSNIAIRTCRYCWLNVPIASASVSNIAIRTCRYCWLNVPISSAASMCLSLVPQCPVEQCQTVGRSYEFKY